MELGSMLDVPVLSNPANPAQTLAISDVTVGPTKTLERRLSHAAVLHNRHGDDWAASRTLSRSPGEL